MAKIIGKKQQKKSKKTKRKNDTKFETEKLVLTEQDALQVSKSTESNTSSS